MFPKKFKLQHEEQMQEILFQYALSESVKRPIKQNRKKRGATQKWNGIEYRNKNYHSLTPTKLNF